MLRPIGDRVLVKQLDAETTTEGGLFIPTDSQERPPEGVVVAVGRDVVSLHMGDHVVFRKWSPKSWSLKDEEGKDMIVMNESEALAVRE